MNKRLSKKEIEQLEKIKPRKKPILTGRDFTTGIRGESPTKNPLKKSNKVIKPKVTKSKTKPKELGGKANKYKRPKQNKVGKTISAFTDFLGSAVKLPYKQFKGEGMEVMEGLRTRNAERFGPDGYKLSDREGDEKYRIAKKGGGMIYKDMGGLVGGQAKLDMNKDGMITGQDFKMMPKKYGGKITYRMSGGKVTGAGYDD